MKKWLAIGSVVTVVALAATLVWGAVAFAQGPGNALAFGFNGPGRGGLGGGFGPAQFGPGRGGPGGGFGGPAQFGPRGFGGAIDHEALLADALGITVEELEAAKEQAHNAAIDQALAEGLITQEEADEARAHLQLRSYLDREALMAEALGVTGAELEQAQADGKPLVVLAYELGLDPVTIRTNMQTAQQNALQQAVADGVITQEQADQFEAGPGPGRGGPGRGGRHGGPGGFGGFGPR